MEIFFEFFKNHWLVIAFLAPMFWALVNIIDVYFVGGIYKDELDGTIISGLFQLVPWTILFFVADINLSDALSSNSSNILGLDGTFILSFIGGLFYTASFYFYYKALFSKNDVSLLQIFWSLTIIAVPVLSFFIFGERLSVFKYAGMLVVLLGATLLSLNVELRKDFSVKYLKIMLGAVLFLSLSIILEGRAYDLLNETYGAQGFWTGFFFFSLGASTAGLLFALYFQRSPLPLIQKYYKIFIIGEGIYFLGNLFSQKALDIAPSVSYVAAIESFIPVFVLAYSLLILFFFSSILKKENQAVKSIYSEQIKGLWFKIPATIIMALGIYIIS